jgi:hypothetical protein
MSPSSVQASLLGTRLTLWIGPTIAVPAPALIAEALASVEVSLSDDARDGFEITFTVGRTGVLAPDFSLVALPLLKPMNRVVIQVWLGAIPHVLIDGFITATQLQPSEDPGASTLTVRGEDMRVLMDLHEVSFPYPSMSVTARVEFILLRYMTYLAFPPVVPPTDLDVPLPTRQIPVQADTDLRYLEKLAAERGCVFYVEPTPVPMVNLAYWGVPPLAAEIQSALSVNMGSDSNAKIDFHYNGLTPTLVLGAVQDKTTVAVFPIVTVVSTRPPLVPLPSLLLQGPNIRTVMPKDSNRLDPVQAFLRAQAQTDKTRDSVTARGELDMLRYGDVLRPRRLVSVRGAGYMNDGSYYVKSVTHRIKKSQYTQQFTLSREGLGAISPLVPV